MTYQVIVNFILSGLIENA